MSHIEQFCESAIAKGDGTSLNDSEHFDKMQEAIIHIKELSNLLPLLNHKNEWVVCWVASHLLANGYSSVALKSLNELAIGSVVVKLNWPRFYSSASIFSLTHLAPNRHYVDAA